MLFFNPIPKKYLYLFKWSLACKQAIMKNNCPFFWGVGGVINIYFNTEQLFHFLNCLHMLGKLNVQHPCKSCLSREHARYLNIVSNLNNSMNNHKASWFPPLWIWAHEKPICSSQKPWRSISSWEWLCRSWLSLSEAPFWVSHQSCHLQTPRPLPILAAETCKMHVQLRQVEALHGRVLSREDNVWLPAVKSQTAPSQTEFEINI